MTEGDAYSRPYLEVPVNFAQRHIGPDEFSQQQMLTALGYASLDELTAAALPAGRRDRETARAA